MRIAISYALFALFATAANIATQELSLLMYGGRYSLLAAVFAGTVVGLVLKYILDKKYIFAFRFENTAHDARVFVLYTVVSVITTAVFWGFEFSFDYFFQSKIMRYTGAVIGLGIGYYMKYQLDKKFVFVVREA